MMDRVIASNCAIISSDNEFVVELGQSDVPVFALEFAMLVMGVVDKLTVLFENDRKLQVLLRRKMSPAEKALVSKMNNSLVIEISSNQLDYICAFLLRAYRDGVAEVSHVHIEGVRDGGSFDLTLLFDNYVAPLTPEQASKLMDE